MFVSILQRLGFRAPQHPGEPLQSRADFNTRTSPSGGPGKKVRANTGLETAAATADKPDNQLKNTVGPTKISLTRRQGHPEAAPRGDTL